MTTSIASLVLLVAVAATLFTVWGLSAARHVRRIDQLEVRVHVNGTRGKSSVTRLMAGVLREGGFVTVAKTTGSAARVIDPKGEEIAIRRRGAATINEQVEVVRDYVSPDVDALVIECMAVRPDYQGYSQDHMVRSDITVITNVRQDHQEEMGETLEEIADSMSLTIPWGGVLITAEDRAWLRDRLHRNAARRSCAFVYADPAAVSDEDLEGFDYVQYKENVAVGLALGELLGLDRRTALEGMWNAAPDVGAIRLRSYDVRGKQVLWVPMFAANDRESVVRTFEMLEPHFAGSTVIGILNNRPDRGRRAELFGRLVPESLGGHLDHVITFGCHEDPVTRMLVAGGYPAGRVHNLGDSVRPTLPKILQEVADLIDGDRGVLIGMVNIHTAQAAMLLDHFDARHQVASASAPVSPTAGALPSIPRQRGAGVGELAS